ncbi:hypothetical protein ACIQNV_37275 [Streptomyces hydrogenans]|uniref:hypothetical protein n=1 Tax=Streptomyces hydrogenans TaxID=1873719 RepID=UPI0037F8F174
MSTHPDLPDTLVHFTGRPRGPRDLPPDFAGGSAEDRLVSILHTGALRGAPDFWSDAPVICFSEVTEDARRVMLRDGAGTRGPYAPWGLVLDRQRLIAAGARPVLYLSGQEMSETHQLPTRLRNRRVRYDPGHSDWLHEREWRVCFEAGDEPVLSVAPRFAIEAGRLSTTPSPVVGIIVGTQGWTPPPRNVSQEEMTSTFVTRTQNMQRLMRERPDLLPSGVIVNSPVIDFAYPANGLARWHWTGTELLQDGVIDIHAQQRETTMRWGGTLPGLSVTLAPEDDRQELRGDGRV